MEDWEESIHRLSAFRYRNCRDSCCEICKLSPTVAELPAAPVDTVGCSELCSDAADAPVRYFQILIALLLSSQTKDPVTADAMSQLHSICNEKSSILKIKPVGLCIAAVLKLTEAEISKCICKVGFWRKKTQNIIQIANILHEQHNDVVPPDLDILLSFPGIGPKMAYLFLQSAYDIVEGIGVDTHVHRISRRLEWTSAKAYAKGPEATRKELESWLPKSYWRDINKLLVGMGQLICLPVRPKCDECVLRLTCPSSKSK